MMLETAWRSRPPYQYLATVGSPLPPQENTMDLEV